MARDVHIPLNRIDGVMSEQHVREKCANSLYYVHPRTAARDPEPGTTQSCHLVRNHRSRTRNSATHIVATASPRVGSARAKAANHVEEGLPLRLLVLTRGVVRLHPVARLLPVDVRAIALDNRHLRSWQNLAIRQWRVRQNEQCTREHGAQSHSEWQEIRPMRARPMQQEYQ